MAPGVNPESTRYIHGTYSHEAQELPEELPEVPPRPLDADKYSIWASETAQTSKDREILKTLGENIRHISYASMEIGIQAQTKAFLKGIGDQPYVALVEPGKSQSFVTAVAMKHGLAPIALIRLGPDSANMLKNSLTSLSKGNSALAAKVAKTRHFVIADDASFSGNQMANNITAALRALKSRYGQDFAPEFHAIVPHMTKTAHQKVLDVPPKVHLYTSAEFTPVLRDIFPKKADLERAGELLDVPESRFDSSAATYSDLKIPHSMAAIPALETGGFIPNHDPVYKSPPFELADRD